MHLISHISQNPDRVITVTVQEAKKKVKTFLVPLAARGTVEHFLKQCLPAPAPTLAAATVLPELADARLRPATMLRASRTRARLTQKALAAKLGVLQHHLSEMEHGKRAIGKQMAKKLASVFESDYRLFV